MKKKIMMGLGAIAAIAAPVVGLISCGDKETLAEKLVSAYPSKFEVKANNKDFDFLKSMTTDGADINKDMFFEIDFGDTYESRRTKVEEDSKDFGIKLEQKTATMEETAKVIKGFADNKITIEVKIVAAEIKPKIINRGTATKEIEITFLAS